jgi:hypothetical protein
VCSYKGICFVAAIFTLLLIPSTPDTVSGTTVTPTGTENVGVYSAIAISTHINIVYK